MGFPTFGHSFYCSEGCQQILSLPCEFSSLVSASHRAMQWQKIRSTESTKWHHTVLQHEFCFCPGRNLNLIEDDTWKCWSFSCICMGLCLMSVSIRCDLSLSCCWLVRGFGCNCNATAQTGSEMSQRRFSLRALHTHQEIRNMSVDLKYIPDCRQAARVSAAPALEVKRPPAASPPH